MVHQYKNNGYNMVLDVASGSVHVVDDLTYEVIALYEDHTLEEIIKELSSWDEKDVKESYGEVTELKDAGVDTIIAEKQAQVDAWMATK